MEAKAVWKENMSFEGSATSGFRLPLGSRMEAGDEIEGFSPMEVILVALAGCTGMDVLSILKKKRQELTAFEVNVLASRAEDHPRVFTTIMIEYTITGHNLDLVAINRAVELSETKYCSVQAMLGKTARIEHKIILHQSEVS